MLSSLGRVDEAVRALERAHRLDPRSPVPLQQMAYVYVGAGRQAEARAAYRALLDLLPTRPYIKVGVAGVAAAVGEREDAFLAAGLSATTGAAVDKVPTSSYFACMKAVGVKVLKNKLSEYVRLAESGETVLVTDRDRVVAELGPPRPGRAPLVADALLADAVREGWISAPLIVAEGPPPRQPVATWNELRQELESDRNDR